MMSWNFTLMPAMKSVSVVCDAYFKQKDYVLVTWQCQITLRCWAAHTNGQELQIQQKLWQLTSLHLTDRSWRRLNLILALLPWYCAPQCVIFRCLFLEQVISTQCESRSNVSHTCTEELSIFAGQLRLLHLEKHTVTPTLEINTRNFLYEED